MANRRVVQDKKFIYGWDDVAETPVFSADHGSTWNAIGGGGGAFQITAGGGGIAENISDDRATPGNNTVDGTADGQFNAGVEPGLIGAPPYGTDDDYATVGGGSDNYAGAPGSTVAGGRGNRIATAADNAFSWGRENDVDLPAGAATGYESQARNTNERSHAYQEYPEGKQQERVVLLTREIGIGAGDSLPLYTNYIAAGTEEFITVVDHSYHVAVMVQGSRLDVIGGMDMAAWRLEAGFTHFSGSGLAVATPGVTTTFICNTNTSIFNVTPTLVASGTNIRVTGSDDGLVQGPIRWIARMVVTELAPLPFFGGGGS